MANRSNRRLATLANTKCFEHDRAIRNRRANTPSWPGQLRPPQRPDIREQSILETKKRNACKTGGVHIRVRSAAQHAERQTLQQSRRCPCGAMRFASIAPYGVRLTAFEHQTPLQAMKKWQKDKPELFVKRVSNRPGLDS